MLLSYSFYTIYALPFFVLVNYLKFDLDYYLMGLVLTRVFKNS